jgi:hypothetical protein
LVYPSEEIKKERTVAKDTVDYPTRQSVITPAEFGNYRAPLFTPLFSFRGTETIFAAHARSDDAIAFGLERSQSLFPGSIMNDVILACAYSGSSHRQAILIDDGVTGILYLHASSDDATRTGDVEATCFAYNRIDPIDPKDVKHYRPKPPPIATPYASQQAVCHTPGTYQWNINFSSDGTAVVLIRDGHPWAMASLAAPRGYSCAIKSPGPWGNPWSNEAYLATEWNVPTEP